MPTLQKIVPFLWFDTQAEEAAKFYTAIFPDSRIVRIAHRPPLAGNHPDWKLGEVMAVEFELNGQGYVALNGGPNFPFTQAISLMVYCEAQEEVDYYWERLTAGGGSGVACGWLKDKYGLSWQVTPTMLMAAINDADSVKAGRAMTEMMKMEKIDIAAIEQACAG